MYIKHLAGWLMPQKASIIYCKPKHTELLLVTDPILCLHCKIATVQNKSRDTCNATQPLPMEIMLDCICSI